MLPQRLHPSRLLALALFSLVLGLAGCQTKPPQTGLSAEQIAVLQEQGFELRDEGWEFGMSSKVLFGNNLDRLNPDSRNTLTKIARALLAVDIDKVRLEGHTDNYGDEGYNQKALRTARRIGGRGIPRSRHAGGQHRGPRPWHEQARGR